MVQMLCGCVFFPQETRICKPEGKTATIAAWMYSPRLGFFPSQRRSYFTRWKSAARGTSSRSPAHARWAPHMGFYKGRGRLGWWRLPGRLSQRGAGGPRDATPEIVY